MRALKVKLLVQIKDEQRVKMDKEGHFMKIDRLIGILSILLQQEKVTAPYLAEKFEVSRRTINRDIEDLCKAGIPLVTTQGQNGGISIMEGYRIDRTVLTSSDMKAILTGLKSLDTVSGTGRYQQLMDKLSVKGSLRETENNHIYINLSSWYQSSLVPKMELIQQAIHQRHIITFDYYGPNGESQKTLEPYLLVFQWSAWYVWGYCRDREDCRMFKLNRMEEVKMTEEPYELRDVKPFDPSPYTPFPSHYLVKALCQPEMKWRLIEEFGRDSFTVQEDGNLLFEFGFSEKWNIYSWVLSMGTEIELLEPKELREEFAHMTRKIAAKYEKPG
jgi:predicted DNA-binding transcriptional regulator YafY